MKCSSAQTESRSNPVIDVCVAKGSNMMEIASRRIVGHLSFYIGAVALVAGAWLIQSHVLSFASPPSDTPTPWQQMAVQIASETTRLLTTLGTGLLGGIGFLFGKEARASNTLRHSWAALLCALCAGLSLYYGYVVHLNLLWMITYNAFDATSEFFLFPSHAQFYWLLLGGFFFTDFAVFNLWKDHG
jgi:hypothetical protein